MLVCSFWHAFKSQWCAFPLFFSFGMLYCIFSGPWMFKLYIINNRKQILTTWLYSHCLCAVEAHFQTMTALISRWRIHFLWVKVTIVVCLSQTRGFGALGVLTLLTGPCHVACKWWLQLILFLFLSSQTLFSIVVFQKFYFYFFYS